MVMVYPCNELNCGRAFRLSLRKPSPNMVWKKKAPLPPCVPAFSVQSRQANTKVCPPNPAPIYEPRPVKQTMFKFCYNRGEFPIALEFDQYGKRLSWKVPVEKLDYHHYLPIFFEGLAETESPYNFFVMEGIRTMIKQGSYKILPVVPQLIVPMKKALNTKISKVICNTLIILQSIVTNCDRVGEALVPYYRQLLPVLNLYKDINLNLLSGVDYTAARRENIGDLITETLEILERYGGEDAFINIKYMIPTYESCILN